MSVDLKAISSLLNCLCSVSINVIALEIWFMLSEAIVPLRSVKYR